MREWRPPASPTGATTPSCLLIRHGESVETVQARLGHASASETLDTYSRLWPDSDDRTRVTVDAVLAPAAEEQLRNEDPRRT